MNAALQLSPFPVLIAGAVGLHSESCDFLVRCRGVRRRACTWSKQSRRTRRRRISRSTPSRWPTPSSSVFPETNSFSVRSPRRSSRGAHADPLRPDDEHVVLITIDRPEARNACDMEHFKVLREAWERFAADDQAWVAIVTGVGEAFFSGADLKTYIPEITKFQKRDRRAGSHRDQRLPARRRHPRRAAQLAALQAGHRRGERLLHRRAAWRCSAAATSASRAPRRSSR